MKQRTKGLLAFAFLGGLMVTSGVVIAIPGMAPEGDLMTNTHADQFLEEDREKYCGTSNASSTKYVKEFDVRTQCSLPLAITTDYEGNVWFAQTNTGSVAKFNPETEIFLEYPNPNLQLGRVSMMWGMDYAPDGSVWFTDDATKAVWKFSSITNIFEGIPLPTGQFSLPQKLQIFGSKIIVNDFLGNSITAIDPNPVSGDTNYLTVPSPIANSVTSDFTLDAEEFMWYTNWIDRHGGVLVRLDQQAYFEQAAINDNQRSLARFVQIFDLPEDVKAANGITTSESGEIWIADTASSFFFSFNPSIGYFTKYITSTPPENTYGNVTGVIQNPVSRPYWMETNDQNQIVFNEHNANRIAIFDPVLQSLVEYHVPSKNPHWGDCTIDNKTKADCGVAQIFDFAIDGEKIWFTEWVENSIGVVDTSIPLPVSVQTEPSVFELEAGDNGTFTAIFIPRSNEIVNGTDNSTITTLSTEIFNGTVTVLSADEFLNAHIEGGDFVLNSNQLHAVNVMITVSEETVPGIYKILLGVQSSEITISKYVTVAVR